jgi:hypothetical protein
MRERREDGKRAWCGTSLRDASPARTGVTIGLDMQTYMTELLDELISNQDSGAQAAPEFKRQRKPTKVKKRQRAQPDGGGLYAN